MAIDREKLTTNYTFGNLATDYLPEYQPQIEQEQEQVVRKKKVIRTIDRQGVNSKIIFLAMATVVTVGALLVVLSFSQISSKYEDVQRLKVQLENIKKDNALIEEKIMQDMKLNQIKDYATNELGMVQPNGNQVTYFTLINNSFTEEVIPIQKPSKKKINISLSFGRN